MHLILLVGTNPVPNYVAAMHVSHQENVVYHLVHTLESSFQRGTRKTAEALQESIIRKTGHTVKLVPLRDASHSIHIYEDLNEGLKDIPNGADIVLNYTGGTKAMAVHCYTWMVRNRADSGAVFFQYLDARSHRIFADSCGPVTNDLREDKAVGFDSIDAMLGLHGYEPPSTKTDPFTEITEKLGELIAEHRIDGFLEMVRLLRSIYHNGRNWCYTVRKLQENLALETKRQERKSAEELLRSQAHLAAILKSFPEPNRIITEDGLLWAPDSGGSNNDVINRVKRCLSDYLDGKWLEFHAMRAISQIASASPNVQFGNSLESKKCDGGKSFELDLFILRGYQLIGISVTTAGEYEAKLKAFEVMHRVRQIGGDESRSILVANLSDDAANKMANDINFLLQGSASDHFSVIGKDDWGLSKLRKRLEATWS